MTTGTNTLSHVSTKLLPLRVLTAPAAIAALVALQTGCAGGLAMMGVNRDSYQLDEALKKGDDKAVRHICDASYTPKPSEATRTRACEAAEAKRNERLARLTCDNVVAKSDEVSRDGGLPKDGHKAYGKKLVECNKWDNFYSGDPVHVPDELQIQMAKTPTGETALRAFLASANEKQLASVSSWFLKLEKQGGPKLADEVANAYGRLKANEASNVYFDYLVHQKHPKAVDIAQDRLNSRSARMRIGGCWAAGELGEPKLRGTVEDLTARDSFSEVEGNGRGVSVHYPVRDACREALGKMQKRVSMR